MSYSCFTDRKQRPSLEDIQHALGPRLEAFDQLAGHVRAVYAADEDLHYLYGKKYGWALRFQIKRQMLVNLYPNQGCFYAQVNLPESAVQAALGMGVNPRFRAAIDSANVYSEGRWLWFAIENDEDMHDVQRLIELRSRSR